MATYSDNQSFLCVKCLSTITSMSSYCEECYNQCSGIAGAPCEKIKSVNTQLCNSCMDSIQSCGVHMGNKKKQEESTIVGLDFYCTTCTSQLPSASSSCPKCYDICECGNEKFVSARTCTVCITKLSPAVVSQRDFVYITPPNQSMYMTTPKKPTKRRDSDERRNYRRMSTDNMF